MRESPVFLKTHDLLVWAYFKTPDANGRERTEETTK